MNSDLQSKTSIQTLVCPACSGVGQLNGHRCPVCQGFGVIGWNGTSLLYWGKQISTLHIFQDTVFQSVKTIINAILLIFGTTGLIMFGWVLFAASQAHISVWLIFEMRNWQLFVFWLSLLTDCYIVYRFNRELEKIRRIPAHPYEHHQSQLPGLPADMLHLPPRYRLDISEYYTQEAIDSIVRAWQLASKYKDEEVKPIHVLVALLSTNQVQIIFSRLGTPFDKLKSKIANVLARQVQRDADTVFSLNVRKLLFDSYQLADVLHQKKVEVTEILEALASQDNEVKELLYDLAVDQNKIINVASWLRIRRQLRENWQRFRHRASLKPKDAMNRSMTAIATPTLDAFSQDLTLLARAGYLLPCIGREREIRDIFNILTGSGRKSAVLIGSPGVGRNTIAEGIAQQMVAEDVPNFLRDKRLVSLSIAHLVSGASPSQAQQRLMMILSEVRRSGNIILYVKDIHNMIGITAGREGSVDLADVFAQALRSNTISAIVTTTAQDYRHYIESKSSLDTVLEKVNVNEVSGNQAIQILESKAGTFEYKYNVFFSYDAIAEVVRLSDRYLHDRYLPEKAIAIMQEIAQRVREQKGKQSIISANDVATLISEKTNIPLANITQEESQKLLTLEARIHERMVDQEEAVSIVASSIRRARAEMRDTKRPIVNLLFLGPTGVGKTELAKTVAEVYFGAEENMIRLDMSEYQDKASINRLIGAPPGYSDNTGGQLSEAVRKNPFSLVLLDEIEKAHPDILNIFLQILDDGRLTDNTGRTIDFTNTIIIATSNAGTKYIQEQVRVNIPIEQIKNGLLATELNQYFRPEFLNRFDGIIVFKPLSMNDVRQITQLLIQKIAKTLSDKGIGLEASQAAIDELAAAGFDPEFGARPLRRVIQQRIQDPLANEVLAGHIGRRDRVVIEAGGKLTIKKAEPI